MTKQEFLDRCANAWDTGRVTPERLRLMRDWLDFVMRFEGGQISIALEFLNAEAQRNHAPMGNMSIGNLAGDTDGYALQEFAAILAHTCQKCATDPTAWWTRAAFCEHKEKK